MSKMKQCYTCGYEECILSRVVYCVHCKEAMVHRYCMDPPRHGDEEFDWVCEECCPRVNQHSKLLRISEFLCSKLDSEAEKGNSHCHEEDSNKSVGSLKEFVVEAEICGNQPLKEEENPEGFTCTDTRLVKKLRLHSVSKDFGEKQCDLEAKESSPGICGTTQKENSADLERVSRACDQSQCSLQTSNCLPKSKNLNSCLPSVSGSHERSSSLIHDSNGHLTETRSGMDGSHKLDESLLPISNISWRRTCHVTHEMHKMSVELGVCRSNSGNFKVFDALRTLPSPLELEMVDKFSKGPERIPEEPPCTDDIGLYSFPPQESDRKAYDDLLGKMIVGDLLLRFSISGLRLLVLSSSELPKGIQRINGKLYLWGVLSAPLSLSSSLVPGDSSGSSCLEEEHANNGGSPTGVEVQSVRKGQDSSDTIQPTQQNTQRGEVRNLNVRDPPQSDKKRKRRKSELPDQRMKLDAPGNIQPNPANKPNSICNRDSSRSEKGSFNQQIQQNLGSPGFIQRKKNKQKQKQKKKQFMKPCASFPVGQHAAPVIERSHPQPGGQQALVAIVDRILSLMQAYRAANTRCQ